MGIYKICGGRILEGEVSVSGSKNAVLPILAATVLNSGESCIHNCPKISDCTTMIEILEAIGCKVKQENNTIIVNSKEAYNYEVPEKQVKEMRSSIIFLGSMIGRFKKAVITYPGGCSLGARPIDLHLKALKQMGVKINEEDGFIVCETERLKGADIYLDFPSVGATENIMLAAVLAESEVTIIHNPAKEPEIVDLQNFLNAMGARIYGAGESVIYIEGVKELHNVEYEVMPDRIVAGTLLIAAAITKGEVLLKKAEFEDISVVISKLKESGCKIYKTEDGIYLKSPKILKAADIIRTQPYPGFPTDMQPQFATLMTVADGTTIIIETVFESRYKYISELIRMGANILIDGRMAVIQGGNKLKGAKVSAMDLRGGAALILAGLAAEGTTFVDNSKHIKRGYESIEKDLTLLGADIIFEE